MQNKKNSMKILENRIREVVHSVLEKRFLLEYRYKREVFIQTFIETLNPIIDNLACIKLYPNSQAVHHWRNQIVVHSNNVLSMNIKNNDTPNIRKNYLCLGLEKYFSKRNNDLSINFRKIVEWYQKKDKNQQLFPYAPVDVCFKENKDKILDALEQIIVYIANKDLEGLTNYAHNVY